MYEVEINSKFGKKKIMVVRKIGRLPNKLRFQYKDSDIEIVSKFKYLGIVFTSVAHLMKQAKR